MAILDFLIDKTNGQPKPDMEYIYRLDMVWTPNKLEGKSIKIGTIVTNVVQLENKGYQFICKETGELLRTNYAWALAENTPENVKRIAIYEKEYIEFKKFEKKINSLRNNITTLKPKK
jgi:hypothetical protein